MKSDEKLYEGSELTVVWLEKVLQEKLGTTSKIVRIGSNRVGLGQGYVSQLYRVRLKWDADGNLPTDFVLKIPMGKNMLTHFDNPDLTDSMERIVRFMHKTECIAYEFLSPFTDLPVPKTYVTKQCDSESSGIIVMDFMDESCLIDLFAGFNEGQLLSIADGLARVHAKSLESKDWVENFDIASLRAEFGRLCVSMLSDLEEKTRDKVPEFYTKYAKPGLADFDPQKDVLDALFDAQNKFKMSPVFVHGDFWSNNLLFKKEENGKPGNELMAFVDLQFAHPGSCMQDLAEVLVLACDPEIRRKHTVAVVKYYYARLTQYTQEAPPFELDDLWRPLKELEKAYTYWFLLTIPLIFKLPELEIGNRDLNLERIFDRIAKAVEDFLSE